MTPGLAPPKLNCYPRLSLKPGFSPSQGVTGPHPPCLIGFFSSGKGLLGLAQKAQLLGREASTYYPAPAPAAQFQELCACGGGAPRTQHCHWAGAHNPLAGTCIPAPDPGGGTLSGHMPASTIAENRSLDTPVEC